VEPKGIAQHISLVAATRLFTSDLDMTLGYNPHPMASALQYGC
jgi:hypothetical protein